MKDSTERGGYQRPISAVDWWFLAHPPRLSPVIQTVIEGAGEFAPGQLPAAIAVASQANPGSRLRARGQTWADSGLPPPLRVVAGRADGLRVADVAALHDPLPGAGGALCEVLWCPGSPSVLAFRTSHAVMDGQGKAMWIADVFRALRGEAPLGAAAAITEVDVFDRLGSSAAKPKPDVWAPSPLPRPAHTKGRRRTAWARRTVDGYHPALVAKVATTLTAVYGLDQARYSIPFDLRRHVPESRTTGNLVQVELFDVAAGDSWEVLHERLLTVMAEADYASWNLDRALLKVPLPVLRTLVRLSEPGKKDQRASTSLISNLGRVELDELCTPSFEARTMYLTPLLPAMSPPCVDLVECGGRTEMTLTWRDGPGLARRADAVLEQVAQVLSPVPPRSWPGNDTGRPRSEATVVERFRAQALNSPQAVALSWPDGQLSFAELDHRSEVAAARLVSLGVGRESVIGLLADRTSSALIGLWGVLKAGAAYLPLDPQHPDGRLADLLSDAGAALCLVQRSYAGRTGESDACRNVVIEDLPFDQPQPQVTSDPGPGDLAYLIYTSGSTGTPKGVEIEHRALANYVDWATERFEVDASTNFAVFTSLAFDLPNTALYLSTLAGGTLVLMPDEPNHLSLQHLLEKSGANALKLTPTHLDLIGRLDLRPNGFSLLVVGGEALRPEVAEHARGQFGADCRIFNHYGPTEATVGCVVNPYGPSHDAAVVPIGAPAGNCQVHLLDATRRFVAAGDVGEMYLGGAQLARGYRGRPDLTRERFGYLADGSRVYRSGDLARVLPSGELEFIGRVDDQVKVMGYRVEPAETARALEAHPLVRKAVVVLRRSPHGANVLCAYVIAEPGATVAQLEQFLDERLPRYLVPAAIVLIDDYAHTANGKIDVRALPDPFQTAAPGSATPGTDPPEPLDEVRESIATVWADTLRVEARSLDSASDFHHLGGNSVLLLAMLAAVSSDVVGAAGERAFMSELGQIIRQPTLARVSELAREARDAHVSV